MHPHPDRRRFVQHAALAGAWLWATGRSHSADAPDEGLSEAEFRALHRQLQPPADEPWRTIPWELSIADACRRAVREKKPVLMRVRSGHPLGCV